MVEESSVHIDKLPVLGGANSGDPISIRPFPKLTQTIWQHNIEGEPVQQCELAQGTLALWYNLLLALAME
jgi:hypothetical protein